MLSVQNAPFLEGYPTVSVVELATGMVFELLMIVDIPGCRLETRMPCVAFEFVPPCACAGGAGNTSAVHSESTHSQAEHSWS